MRADQEHPTLVADSHLPSELSGACLAEVSASIVQLYRRFYGRGPTRAKTVAQGDVLTTVLEDILTRVERTLVGRDRGDLVVEVRAAFQAAMADEFVATVERATGRRVEAFSSGVDVERGIATETFVFAGDAPVSAVAEGVRP